MTDTLQMQPDLDEYQRAAVEGFRQCHSLAHIVHGPPGTGKTVVSALITHYAVECDMGVLVVAPSHSATNRSFKQIKKLQAELPSFKHPIRLYRGVHEKQHLQGQRKVINDDQAANEDANIDDQAANEDANNDDQAANEDANNDNDLSFRNIEDAEMLGHNFVAEIAALKVFKDAPRKKQFSTPEDSLSARIIEVARTDTRRVCQGQYFCQPAAMKRVKEGRHWKSINSNPFVDFWDEMRAFLDRFENGDRIFDFANEDKARFRRCYLELQRDIMAEQRIIVTTDGNATKLPAEFAKGTNGIIVIFDEAAFIMEVRIWAVLLRLPKSTPVRAIVLIGDHEQLNPLVLGNEYNEFGLQMEVTLIQRLLAHGFPSRMLRVQHRMHPSIAAFPFRYTYDGLVTNGGGVRRKLPLTFQKFLEEITKQKVDAKMRVTMFDMGDGETQTEALSQSRYNEKNVQFIVAFFIRVMHKCGLEVLSQFVILTPYGAQKRRLKATFAGAANYLGIPWTHFPPVHSVDSFQGEDSRFVLVDLVLTSGDKLRFMSDARRMNVTCTRAQDYIAYVGQVGMAFTPEYQEDWTEKKVGKTGISVPNTKPYLIALLEELVKKRYCIEVWAGPDRQGGKTVSPADHFHLEEPAYEEPAHDVEDVWANWEIGDTGVSGDASGEKGERQEPSEPPLFNEEVSSGEASW